jgi:hypothetical protein
MNIELNTIIADKNSKQVYITIGKDKLDGGFLQVAEEGKGNYVVAYFPPEVDKIKPIKLLEVNEL